MKKRYDIQQFYGDVIETFDKAESETDFPSYFYKSYFDGTREFYQKERTEYKKFDIMWIRTIESYFPSINRITINVKSTLKYQSEILPIEKTKRINKESVKHLMSHSNLIKEIDEDGNVIPKQILTVLPEIEYGIYENRFIMTLIHRLRDFIGKRLKIIRANIKAERVTHLNVNSEFNFDNADYEMKVDLKQKESFTQRKIEEHNIKVLERAENLYKLICRLENSSFMQIMKRFKPVNPPIMKTQVILKNPDFKNAYLLWLFLDKYNELDYDLNVKTVNKRFTPLYTKHLNQMCLMTFSTLLAHDKSKNIDESSDGKASYRKKSAKSLSKLPNEINPTPYKYQVEDQNLSEYYLNKSKNILKKQIDYNLEENENFKVALKTALEDSLKITNSLYESYFKINADEDIFQSLVKEDDPKVMLDDAKEKYSISKTIREVKERDYKRAIKLEKKWQQEVMSKQKDLINQIKSETEGDAQDIIDERKLKLDKQRDKRKKQMLQEKNQIVQKNKKELAEFKKKLNAELRAEKAKLKQKSKEKVAKEKERLKIKAQKQKAKDAERQKQKKAKLREKQRQQKADLREKQKINKQQQKENIKNKTNASLEKIQSK